MFCTCYRALFSQKDGLEQICDHATILELNVDDMSILENNPIASAPLCGKNILNRSKLMWKAKDPNRASGKGLGITAD
jgi:hypothetical protein